MAQDTYTFKTGPYAGQTVTRPAHVSPTVFLSKAMELEAPPEMPGGGAPGDQLLRSFLANRQTRGEFGRSALADPANRPSVGGMIGGTIGALSGNPLVAIAGAALGGAGGSFQRGDRNPEQIMKEGMAQGFFEAAGGIPALIARPAAGFGRGLVKHAWGPQREVSRELATELGTHPLDTLTDLKLQRTGPLDAVGTGRLEVAIQDQIDPLIAERQRILAGSRGDIPAPANAVFEPVTPNGGPRAGQTLHPVKDTFAKTRGPVGNSGDVKAAATVVKDYLTNDPRTMAYGQTLRREANPEYVTVQRNLAEAGFSPEIQASFLKDIEPSFLPDKQAKNVLLDIPARERQNMITSTYAKLDDAGAWMNDAAANPKRDMLKAITRSMKEGLANDIPAIRPLNEEMSQLIPLREAAVQAQTNALNHPPVRFGEAAAATTGNPRFALASLFNRPVAASIAGHSLYNAGNHVARNAVGYQSGLANLLRGLTLGGGLTDQ